MSKNSDAKEAVAEYEKARDDLHVFFKKTENQKFLDSFIPIMKAYNTLLKDAKDQVREMTGPDKISIGSFTRSAKSKSVKYDATKINPEVLLLKGVVKSIDPKIVEDLILTGRISHADVEGGQSVEYGRPKVFGPKEIMFDIVGGKK
jgi:hypothetical protein